MNLPRISYLTDGPAAPERSLDAAAAPARAMARVGSALQSMGEQGFRIAEQVRETKEAGDRAGFMSQVEQEAADFNNSLLTKPDYHQWTQGYRELEAGWKTRARELGLSREGLSVLDRQLLDFTTKQGIALERNVALRTVQESHAKIGHSLKRHAEAGDDDGVARDITELSASGMKPERAAEVKAKAEAAARVAGIAGNILLNPFGALQQLADPEVRKTLLPAVQTLLGDRAREENRKQTFTAIDGFQKGVKELAITTAGDLEEQFPGLDPTLKADLAKSLQHTVDEKERQHRQTPEYQTRVSGEVSELLDTFNPESEDFGSKFHRITGLIATLQEGPMKARLDWRVDQVRKGQQEIWMNAADEYRDRLKTDFEAEVFGPLTTRVTAGDVLGAGLLKDAKKLALAGFSPEDAAFIANIKDPRQQLESFQALYSHRPGFDGSAEFDLDSFQMLAKVKDHRGYFEYPDETKRNAARAKYGAAQTHFENWLSVHPEATEPQISAKYYEVKKPGGAAEARRQIVDPPETQQAGGNKAGAIAAKPPQLPPK